MGIKFYCPNGHKLNVKSFLAGKRGVCPHCDVGVDIPLESQIPSSKKAAVNGEPARGGEPARQVEPTSGAEAADADFDHVVFAAIGGEPSGNAAGPAVNTASAPESTAPTVQGAPAAAVPVGTVPQLGQPQLGDHSAATAPVPSGLPVSTPAQGAVPVGQAAAPAMPAFGETPSFGGNPATPQHAMPASPEGSMGAPLGEMASPEGGMGAPLGEVDPITDSPQAIWYVRPPSGGQFGPARGDTMRKWITEGRVTADSLVWCEGWENWREAGPMFPQLPSPPSSDVAAGAFAAGGIPQVGGPGESSFVVQDSTTPARSLRPHRRNSRGLAIAAVAVLVLVSLGLLVTLGVVLSR